MLVPYQSASNTMARSQSFLAVTCERQGDHHGRVPRDPHWINRLCRDHRRVPCPGRLPGGRSAGQGATLVESVRICSTHGTGFFTIPGTDTCLRIAGRARVEIRYLELGTRADDAIGFRARSRIALDARTRTSTACCGLRRSTSSPATRAIMDPTRSVLTKLSSSSAA